MGGGVEEWEWGSGEWRRVQTHLWLGIACPTPRRLLLLPCEAELPLGRLRPKRIYLFIFSFNDSPGSASTVGSSTAPLHA